LSYAVVTLGVGTIDRGNIARPYAPSVSPHDEGRQVATGNIDAPRAQAFATENDTRAHPFRPDRLPSVAIVVCVTVYHAHYAALDAGHYV
jgi:hypothetical protein